MPQLLIAIEAAALAAGAGIYLAAGIAVVGAAAIIVIGLDVVKSVLAPDAPEVRDGRHLLSNKRSNNASIPVVYGRRFVGGTIVFLATGNDTNLLHVNLVVSEGEIEEYEAVYFDNRLVLDNSGNYSPKKVCEDNDNHWVESEGVCLVDTQWPHQQDCGQLGVHGYWYDDACIRRILNANQQECEDKGNFWTGSICLKKIANAVDIREYHGTETQQGDSVIAKAISGYNVNEHKLSGTAYLSLTLRYDPKVYTNGLPVITTKIKGVKVFDPRSSLIEFSDNPSLCVRDYLTNTLYGRAIDVSQIDDASFIIAANYCDESVLVGSISRKRYYCDGVVQTDSKSLDILKGLLSCCRGFLVFSGGKYKLLIDKPELPSYTFDEDNIVGGWNFTLGNKKTMFNRVRAHFFDRGKDFQPNIAVADSPELRIEDDGLLLEQTVDLPYTSHIDRAKMIARLTLNQSRHSIVCDFIATVEGLVTEVGDVVYIKHETPGWSDLNNGNGKKFRITNMTLKNDDEVKIQVREYSDSAYIADEIVLTDTAPDTALPDFSFVNPPVNITATESQYTTGNGAGGLKTRINLNWNIGDGIFIEHYEIQYRNNGVWIEMSDVKNTYTSLLDVDPSTFYFRVRAVNTIGVSSRWAQLNNLAVAGLTEPPLDVQNLTI